MIGGGSYQLPLIRRIIEKGDQAYCVDVNPGAVGFAYATAGKVVDVLDKEKCLAYAKSLEVDAVMTYGATITLPTVSYIAERLHLPALPEWTAEISKSKYQIKKCLAEYGCNVHGEFFEMNSPEAAKQHNFSFPCVVKPSDGSGSKGVSLVYDEDSLENAIAYAYKSARYGAFYAESFIAGDEYSVEAFVCGDEIYIYAIVKTTFQKDGNTGEISYGHRTPSGLSEEQECLIEKEIKKAIKALRISMGSVNFDVILSREDGQPYIIDCGMRIGQNLIASHLVPLSRGVSELDNMIKLALGEKPDAKPLYNRCVATRLLIYQPGIITEIKDMQALIGKNGVLDIVMRKGVGDVQNEYREKSDTCGWVVAEGSTPDEAEANAEVARNVIKNYIIIESRNENECAIQK